MIILFPIYLEANTAAQDHDDPVNEWKGGGAGAQNRSGNAVRTPLSGNFPMQNLGKVKFDPPKVPVIFVLGKFRFVWSLILDLLDFYFLFQINFTHTISNQP